MKKILLIIALFGSLFASAQNIPGYTTINSRYYDLDRIFKALGLPAGDSAQHQTGQRLRAGDIYFDSTNNNTPAGLYVWDGVSWLLQGQPTSVPLPDDILFGGSVTPEGGFRFSIQEAIYRIDNQPYTSDSGTVIVDDADATYDRFDVIYLGTDGAFHVLEGIPAENPTIPQLQGDQLLLTVVSIEAGAIQANITTINVYFENDATITPTGTTAVGNATTAPYAGTYHIRITTNNNGDFVDIIKTSGTWDISGQDFLSFHIKNLAVIPQLANWRASLWNGASTGSQVSGEVILNYNKNNATTYQAISIPMSAFGNITNTNIDRIRLRYTSNNATTHTGIDLDNIFFGDNMQQPGTGNFNATLNMPPAFTVSPTNTIQNNGIWNVTANGSSAQYIRGDGSLATFSAVTTVGAFGSQASQVNGLFISGSNIYGQPVTATEPGMATPAMKASWDSSYYVQNLGDGLEIARAIDAATTGLRSLVFIGADTSASNDTTLIIEFTGGTAQRFGFSGEDDVAAEDRVFAIGEQSFGFTATNGGSWSVQQSGGGGDWSNWIESAPQNISLRTTSLLGADTLLMGAGEMQFKSENGNYIFERIPDSSAAGTHYMVAWNEVDRKLYKMDLPTGGGSQDLQDITDIGSVTTDIITAGGFDLTNGELINETGDLTLRGKTGANLNLGANGTNGWFINSAGELGESGAGDVGAYTFQSTLGTSRFKDMVMEYETAPGTPAAGLGILYTKSGDKKLYWKDDAGVEYDLTGGGGDNFYIDDGTIDDLEREVHLAGNTLEFEGGNFYVDIPADKLFYVQHGDGNYLIYGSQTSSFIRGQDSTGDGNEGRVTSDADDEQGRFVARAIFNGAAEEAQIVGMATATGSMVVYEADNHNFRGNILALDDNTNDIGSTTEAFKDIYSRRLLLDGSTSGTPTIFSDALGNSLNGTTLSGTGYLPTVMFGAIQADFTMSDVNTVQPVFPTGSDVWTLQGATTYFFEGSYTLTHGATSHSTGMSFELAGGASVTSINYQTVSWATAIGTNTASQTTNNINVATNSAVNAAGAIAVESIVFSGIIRMNAGGTVTPSITWSAAPGGSPLARIGTWIRFTPIGTNTAASLGNVN